MPYKYLNMNPKGRKVSDCTVRAFALAHAMSWYESYDILSAYAREQCIVIDDTSFIDDFLNERYAYNCYHYTGEQITVRELTYMFNRGVYMITMEGHITCMINGTIFDIWDCRDKEAWSIWEIN